MKTFKNCGTLGAQFIGHIVSGEKRERREGTVTFINDCNCLTSREWAMQIDKKKGHYRVESPVLYGQVVSHIESVLYKDVDDDVAAYWGVLRVSYKI